MQCLNLISDEKPKCSSNKWKSYNLRGRYIGRGAKQSKNYYINPVEMREKTLEKLEIEEGELAQEVPVFEGFITYGAEELVKI